MLAVGPIGPQYCWLFAWYELGRRAHLGVDTLPSQRVPQKILKKSISLYYIYLLFLWQKLLFLTKNTFSYLTACFWKYPTVPDYPSIFLITMPYLTYCAVRQFLSACEFSHIIDCYAEYLHWNWNWKVQIIDTNWLMWLCRRGSNAVILHTKWSHM